LQFGQFILEKIIEIVAIRSLLSKLKCTKFDFGWCPGLAGFYGVLLLREGK